MAQTATNEPQEAGQDISALLSDTLKAKRAAMEAIATDLATVRDLKAEGEERNGEAESFAQRPTILAAEAMAGGLMSKDEVSEMLIGIFGRGKPGKNGKPSKSPSSEGLYYRKRMVTLGEAIEIAEGAKPEPETWPKWAQGKDAGDISDIVAQVREGDIAPFTAYGNLTKRETVTVPLHFDAKKLAKIAEGLATDCERISQSPELKKAYAKIVEAVELLG